MSKAIHYSKRRDFTVDRVLVPTDGWIITNQSSHLFSCQNSSQLQVRIRGFKLRPFRRRLSEEPRFKPALKAKMTGSFYMMYCNLLVFFTEEFDAFHSPEEFFSHLNSAIPVQCTVQLYCNLIVWSDTISICDDCLFLFVELQHVRQSIQ